MRNSNSTLRRALLCVAAVGAVSVTAWGQERLKIGEAYPIHVDSNGWSDVDGISTSTGHVYEISHPGATYIAIHFARFHLAGGDFVIISDANGGQSYTMEGKGKMNAGRFWAQHVKGDTLVLELVSSRRQRGKGFLIDQYAAGFAGLGTTFESICGSNDLENAVCYETSHPTEYQKARAVARLTVMGTGLCTGWLASADNHLITNEHCVISSQEALNVDYEFMAEAPNCTDVNCELCWPGEAIYSGAAFIQDDYGLDYALLQITTGDPAATYGYLEIDNRDATVGEEIYMPQHPAARAKEFGIYCDINPDPPGYCVVDNVTEAPCRGPGYYDVGYWIDTEGGSSGSPVLARSSHQVIALHHCTQYCVYGPNLGVPIDLVYDDICGVMGWIPCCGNGTCEEGEDCSSCPDDCIGKQNGAPKTWYCCGDGVCEKAEDPCNCEIDCGEPGIEICDDGVDNDCDSLVDCDDTADCPPGVPPCVCGETGAPCTTNDDCCKSCDRKTGTCR